MISRRAFSRTAELGQLYDANNDFLLPGSILNLEKEFPKNFISDNLNEYVEHNFLYAESTDDQYKHLNIDASMRLSLYAGFIDIGGSGKYLNTKKINKNSIKGSFYYKLVKKDDELLLENILSEYFSFHLLQTGFCKDATHIVIRRQYGSDLFFTFESADGNKELLKNIETRLDATIKSSAEASFGTEFDSKTEYKNNDIHVSFYGDAKPPSKYKGTVESVLECLTEIDEMTQNPNQMIWDLYPISMLKKIFNIDTNIQDSDDKMIDENKSNILFHDWDILNENRSQLENLHKIVNRDDETYLRNITEKIRLFQNEITHRYKTEIIEYIKLFKSHKKISIEIIINNINKLNDDIFIFINHNKYLLYSNEIYSNSLILKHEKIKNLKGITNILLTKHNNISIEEHKQFKEFILKNKPTRLDHKYYYFCENPLSKYDTKKNLIRYLRLIQMNTEMPKDQRWTHIRSFEVYNMENQKILLNNKYIKIKFSSQSEEWSTGTLLDNDNCSYFHTCNGIYEWIEIDLGANMFVSKVIIKNRIDNGNPHDNPARIIGHELQVFTENSFINKWMVSSTKITKRDYVYTFILDKNGIESCSNDYHVNNFEINKYKKDYNICTLWNSKFLEKYRNSILWYKEDEEKDMRIINNKYMLKLVIPCPHDNNYKEDDYRNWVCYQCGSIAKIYKYNLKWYMVCNECNVIINIHNCYFYCNDPNHGKEPFPCDKDFNFENIKPKYMHGCYLMNDNKSINISFDKIEYVENNIKMEVDQFFYISPFAVCIVKSKKEQDFIILNLNESLTPNNSDIENENDLREEYKKLIINDDNMEMDDMNAFINMRLEINRKANFISKAIYIQKRDNNIKISKIDIDSYHLRYVIIYLMKKFNNNLLSNNKFRETGKWENETHRNINFGDFSYGECKVNDIYNAKVKMLSQYSCMIEWYEPYYYFGYFLFYKNKKIFITIDNNLDTLWCYEVTNKNYNNAKMYKLGRNTE